MNGNIPPIPHSTGDATQYLDGSYRFSTPGGGGLLRHLLINPDGIQTLPPSTIGASSGSSGSRSRDFLSMGAVGLDIVPTTTTPMSIGSLLAYTQYNPGTLTDVTTTSTTAVDVDATNLSITFTVPPSGKVLVVMTSRAYQSVGAYGIWNLRTTSGSNVAGSALMIEGSDSANDFRHTYRVVISGLTPGTSTTYRWGFAVSAGTAHILFGDTGALSPHSGPALMEVWDAAPTITNAISGTNISRVVQEVNTTTGASATGTTTIPLDDTKPQSTEGDEYMTLAITPTSATNKLEIDVIVNLSNSNSDRWLIAALFQDSGTDSLGTAWSYAGVGTEGQQIVLKVYVTAGTTSSTTFKVRAGANAAGTTTFNGSIGNRYFGGSMASSITIKEIVA